MRKNIHTSRRNYNRKNNDLKYYSRSDGHDYRKRRNVDASEMRRTLRRETRKDEQINFFAFKVVICSFLVFAVFIAANIDFGDSLNVRDEIKTALSENISYENIENIALKAEDVFNKNNDNQNGDKNKDEDSSTKKYDDFRIDENIIEQMNKEVD